MARKTTPLCYVSFYVRCSVFQLGYVSLYVRCSVLDLPTGGSRVRCTCTADIVLQCSPCSNVRMCMREELPSLELLLVHVWAVSDISSPGLAYFVSALLRPPFAEYYSMTGELTSSLWFICLCWLFHLRKVCWFWAECNKINKGKLTGSLCFLRFICLCSPFHLRKRVLILFGFRSILISLPLSTVCEEREFTFWTVRLMLDVLSKYSYSLYIANIGTLLVRH